MKARRKKRTAQYKTLILNSDGRPLSTWPLSLIPAQDAVHAWFRDRVIIIEDWPDAFFHSPSTKIAIPKIAMLRHYAPINAKPKFCRRSIFLRDEYKCQYCGKPFSSQELTFDHWVPRARGGRTTWENVLTACVGCNAKKADQECTGRHGIKPLRLPRRPTTAELLRAGLKFLPNDIKEDFGSWLLWEAELDP